MNAIAGADTHLSAYLFVAIILITVNCEAFLQSDSSAHRKVIIHVPLQIKHLTRTIVEVVEKPVVKEYKHEGEIIHHHRHFGHVEHDHSHNIHGPKSPHEQHHRMVDSENFAMRRTPPPPPPPPPEVSSAGTSAKLWQPAAAAATAAAAVMNAGSTSAIKPIAVGVKANGLAVAKHAPFHGAPPPSSPATSNYDTGNMLKSSTQYRQHRRHRHRRRPPAPRRRNNRNPRPTLPHLSQLPPGSYDSRNGRRNSYVRVLFHSIEQ